MAERDELVELEIGTPAHGGSCVARHEGRVVFVRHALPGERVRARLTEDRGTYCRADAVEVLRGSPDRVAPPCPYAGPGRCGGCDLQHASGAAQRALKAAVIVEQFARLAHLDVDVEVESLPGWLLGWRTRITYAVDQQGRPGLHRHRSHDVEHVYSCPLGVAGVGDSPALARTWPGLTGVEAIEGETLLAHRPGPGRQARGRRPPDRVDVIEGPARVVHTVGARMFEVDAAGFWQVHPLAASTFAAALVQAVRPRPGETALDLYAGAGLLTAAVADEVGPTGHVLGVESAPTAVADAQRNLADLPWVQVRSGRVSAALVAGLDVRPDVVVLDPPRSGAGQETMAAILALEPRIVGYVACDPAALARDVAVAVRSGWRLESLRAFDAFPMTHHVECVAALTPQRSSAGRDVGPGLTPIPLPP